MGLVLPSEEKFIPTFRRKKFLVRPPANESVGLVGVAMSQNSPFSRGICFPFPQSASEVKSNKEKELGKVAATELSIAFRVSASKDAGSNQDCRPHSILILRTL